MAEYIKRSDVIFQLTTSHRGRRPPSVVETLHGYLFQLTTSHRGRRRYPLNTKPSIIFQLTTSHRGRQRLNRKRLQMNIYFNSLPHTEVDSNLSQNSERTSMNHITNRTINLYFFHFKHRITITKRKKAVFFWCESPRKIMCTLHSHYKINVPVTSNPGCAPMCSTLFL